MYSAFPTPKSCIGNNVLLPISAELVLSYTGGGKISWNLRVFWLKGWCLNTVMAVAPDSHRISPWSDAFSGRHPSRFSLWNHRVYSNCESGNCQLQAMITSKKDYQGGWSSTLQDHRYITEPYTRSENVRSRNYQMLLSRQDSRRFRDQKHQEIEGCQRDAIRDGWGREKPQESHKPGIPIL